MNPINRDNIIAEITPPGRAAISAIRVSGRDTKDIVQGIFDIDIEKPRYAYFVRHQTDDIIIVYYKAPNSYTGEDVCEIFCHGNPAIVNYLINTVLDVKTFPVRIANSGEFTKRAYLNGKMDLLQAEAVVDVINSSSFNTVRYRNSILRGNFSNVLRDIKRELLNLAVFSELEIDFEEEETEGFDVKEAANKINGVLDKIGSICTSFSKIETLSKEIRAVVIGPVNVGKSSLFNKLIEHERAIVDPVPGTTRDYIEAEIILNDIRVTFIDTAGVRDEPISNVERMGVEKLDVLLDTAMLIIEVLDNDEYQFKNPKAIHVRNKIDVNVPEEQKKGIIYTSAKTGQGVEELKGVIQLQLKARFEFDDSREDFFLFTKRQEKLMDNLKESVKRLLEHLENNAPVDAVSFMTREAICLLNSLLGEEGMVSDDILDELFSRFCIGK